MISAQVPTQHWVDSRRQEAHTLLQLKLQLMDPTHNKLNRKATEHLNHMAHRLERQCLRNQATVSQCQLWVAIRLLTLGIPGLVPPLQVVWAPLRKGLEQWVSVVRRQPLLNLHQVLAEELH